MEVVLAESGNNQEVVSVADNQCPRGEAYVRREILDPRRILTSTVGVVGGAQRLVPVKTAEEIPRNMLMQCMEIIRRTCCRAPVRRGDIIIRDILGTGISVVACADVEKE
jgi:CxxC motif-containing protein